MKRFALFFIGVVFALLGLLWFLQGADLVHINPILCFADCKPITGGSLVWTIVGAVVFIGGIFLVGRGLRRKNSKIKYP